MLGGLVAGIALNATLSPRPASTPQVPATSTPAPGLASPMGEPAGGTNPREVVLSEAQVNQQIAQQLRDNPGRVPFREAQIKLRRDGRVGLRGITQVAGRDAEIQAVVKVDARQGTLNLEIESAQAGNVPVPPIVAQEIAERAVVAAGLAGLKGNPLPDGIEAVAVEEGRLVITRRQ